MSRTYYPSHMVSIGLSRRVTKPVAGLSLLAMIAVAFPTPSQAQQSNTDQMAPAVPGNSQPVQAPAGVQTPSTNQMAPVTPGTTQPLPATPNRLAPVTPGTTQPLPGQSTPLAPGATSTTQPVQVPVDYALGGGDRIRINVFEVPEYSGDYQIPPGGDLYLPLIGRVPIAGLTQDQAAEAVAEKYSRFLKRPLVTVSLISPRPINVVISGEVNSPGSYTVGLQGGAGDNPGVQYPTIVGALTLASGVTLAADLRQVQLRRQAGRGPEQLINLDLTELVKTGKLSKDITLRDGDTIFVPTATSINMAEIREFSTASFAAAPNRPRTVTIVGEVERPGSYVVIGGAAPNTERTTDAGATAQAGGGLPTVTRAIQLAGGIKALADVRNITVRRPTRNGTEQTMNVNLWKLLKEGDTNQDTIVQEGDTIIVPTAKNTDAAEATALATASFSPATIQVSVVGEVKNPGLVNVPSNTPLNQAILTAGGFNDSRARRSSVELVRLNPDGTVTKRRLPVNLASNINDKSNPSLRDNDIVVVGRSGVAKVGDTLGSVFAPILSPFLGILGIFR